MAWQIPHALLRVHCTLQLALNEVQPLMQLPMLS
jgi:hypothetical protein